VKWADFAEKIDAASKNGEVKGGVWSTSGKKFLTSDEFLDAVSRKKIVLMGGPGGWQPGPKRAWLLENLVERNGAYALANGSIGESDIAKIDAAEKQLKGKMFNYTLHYNKKNPKSKLGTRASFEQPLLQVRADHNLPLFAGFYPKFDAKAASRQVSSQAIIGEAQRLDKAFCYRQKKEDLIAQSASNVSFGVYYKERLSEYEAQQDRVFISEGFGSIRNDMGLPALMPAKANEMTSIAIISPYQGTIDARTLNVEDPFSDAPSLNGKPKYDYIWISSVKTGSKPTKPKRCERLDAQDNKAPRAPYVFTNQDIVSYQNSSGK